MKAQTAINKLQKMVDKHGNVDLILMNPFEILDQRHKPTFDLLLVWPGNGVKALSFASEMEVKEYKDTRKRAKAFKKAIKKSNKNI